jgi:hypothetical protein
MAMLAEHLDGARRRGRPPRHPDRRSRHLPGRRAGQITIRADAGGYQQLLDFAHRQVPGCCCWAVEGAGSYGAGLAAFLSGRGEQVLEVGRPKRPAHRTGAKSDALDAVWAASEALGHDHLATPRRRGEREALRVLLTTRRCATRARVAAIG